METYYNEFDGAIEAGVEHVSYHLSWILRSAIFSTCDKEGIVSIVYNPSIPEGIWGLYHGDARSICINLEQHFHHALGIIIDKEGMHSNIRSVILRDLIDTAIHEAHHARKCVEGDDFANSDLDEDGAKEESWDRSWSFGETHDINIESFGTLLDNLIKGLYDDLREDVLEKDCTEWKKLQLHMLENNIAYYDPDNGIEIRTIREGMEIQVQPEKSWISPESSLFHKFYGDKSPVAVGSNWECHKPEPEPETVETVTPLAPSAPKPFTPVTPEAVVTPEVIVPVVAPVIEQTPVTPAPVASAPVTSAYVEDYNPLDDTCYGNIDFENEEYVAPGDTNIYAPSAELTAPPVMGQITPAVVVTTEPVLQTELAAVAPVAPLVAQSAHVTGNDMDAARIQEIAEKVLRRMFHHVFTKCEFNTAGGFNNPYAVLEAISISDIEGASDLMVKQDTLDELGAFKSHEDINGFMKGLTTNDGRPKYTFYIKVGDTLHKRTLMPANPNAVKDGVPTNWAAQAKLGWKIMMLMPEKGAPTAHIKLEPGKALGQEEFQIWTAK